MRAAGARAGRATCWRWAGERRLSPRVRAALAEHTVVLIDVDVQTAWRRAGGRRPAAGARPGGVRRAPRRARRRSTSGLADAIIPAAGARRPGADAGGDRRGSAGRRRGTRLLWATSASAEYPVLIGRGLLGADVWPLPRVAALLRHRRARRPAVPRRASGELDGAIVDRRPGEESKTLASAELVWRRAGPRAGWPAPTISSRSAAASSATSRASARRPTSAACRSCRCRPRWSPRSTRPTAARPGVDLPEAKNYVGAYHQPAGVLVDPATLATLPGGRARGRLRRGAQDGADRRGRAVGAGRRRRRRSTRRR